MAAALTIPTRVDALEPQATQRELDSLEGHFVGMAQRLSMRLLSGWTSGAVEVGHFGIPPMVELALGGALVGLTSDMLGLGWRRAWREIELGHALAPLRFSSPPVPPESARFASAAGGNAAKSFLAKIPVKAREIVERVLVREGGTIQDAMKALAREFPVWSRRQLELTARTVGTHAFNHGRMQSFVESGVVAAVEITAILDSRICARCRGLDGLILSLDLAQHYTPPYHWHCRCLALPIIGEQLAGETVLQTSAEVAAAARENVQGLVVAGHPVTEWPGVMEGFGEFAPLRETTATILPMNPLGGLLSSAQGTPADEIAAIQSAAAILDTLLTFPKPLTPVGIVSSTNLPRASVGGYEPVQHYIAVVARQDSVWVAVHELGHLIDGNAFAERWGMVLRYSPSGNPVAPSGLLLSQRKAVVAVRQLMEGSSMRTTLADMVRAGRMSLHDYFYFARVEEMWARAFSQWVAYRSQDAKLLKHLADEIADEMRRAGITTYFRGQELQNLLQLIDELFKSQQMLKAATP